MNYTHALVSTVDTVDSIPGHRVWLFESEKKAVGFATQILIDAGFASVRDMLEDFQDSLSPTEYFHVLPIDRVT